MQTELSYPIAGEAIFYERIVYLHFLKKAQSGFPSRQAFDIAY